MKIKFIKEYQSFQSDVYDIYEVGTIENMPEMAAQWLIDNGFAEKVDDEWPQVGDAFWSISSDAISYEHDWHNYAENRRKKAIGNVFKTRKAADRFIDYLKAITVVRQDEGVIDLQTVRERCEAGSEDDDFCAYTIAYGLYTRRLTIMGFVDCISASATWFDTEEHAEASIDKHPDEWRTILNYDWGKE